uniref:WD_REPEATS_REGION domain-containing protein n=2 Tax=Caenorhabditis tropicalis TaxID=1561998 RepID=A0A1I7U8A2_9PELO
MDFLHLPKTHKRYLRYPSAVFDDLESKHYFMPAGETDDHDSWVTARFSSHWSQEHILYMGDDPGNIGVFDARKFHDRSIPLEERQLYFFPAHNGAIMDVVSVPNKESHIVSISGDSTIRCWDLNQPTQDRKSQMFFGHEGSVRSISFAPGDPNVFVTGGRDSQVKIWDMRLSVVKKGAEDCRLASATFKTAHPKIDKSAAVGTPKSKTKAKLEGHAVTSVIFLNKDYIASGSDNASSGIRVWDWRKMSKNGPVKVLEVPTSRNKSYGVTCLTMDRFSNRLFASCTDSSIFEYSVPSFSIEPRESDERIKPINSYTGATINNFYTQVACSPLSDTIACGSEDGRAVIWDLQNQYTYMNDSSLPDEIDKRRSKLPQWSCGGHLKPVLNVGWSSRGKYFMSCDEGGIRIWTEPKQRKPWKCFEEDYTPYPVITQDLGLAYESVKRFELKESDEAMTCFDSISLTPRQRSDSGLLVSPQKRRGPKRPIAGSPFTPICPSPNSLKNRSPNAKILKISNSPSKSPFKAVNGYCTPRQERFQRKQKNPFYYEHPTENLPNIVYDNFIKKMTGEEESKETGKSLTKTGRKRIEDWWQGKGENVSTVTRSRLPSVSEFGESACSKVMTENERIALLSPRKLVLKKSPCKSVTTPSTSSNLPKAVPMTPRKPAGHRPTSRNLLHYFKK